MTPVHCRTKHDPENGSYGDCIRAVIASLLDEQPENVPHFAHDNPTAEVLAARLRTYLSPLGLAPWWMHMDGSESRQAVMDWVAATNPGAHYLLFGTTASGIPHVVVCIDDMVAHDPAWYTSPLVGPATTGCWTMLVLVRK